MPHNFDEKLNLDPNTGAPIAAGPVDVGDQGEMHWIVVWMYQDGAGSRGSASFSPPRTDTWECPTQLFDVSSTVSKRFKKGPVLGMAVSLDEKGNTRQYFGWWDDVEIV